MMERVVVASDVLKTELGMVLIKKEAENGVWKRSKISFIVKGPVTQEKSFASRTDAEQYFTYYVERCRKEMDS